MSQIISSTVNCGKKDDIYIASLSLFGFVRKQIG